MFFQLLNGYDEEKTLVDVLGTYGDFHISSISVGIYYANLECRPSLLSPVHATSTSTIRALRDVESQLKSALWATIEVPSWKG